MRGDPETPPPLDVDGPAAPPRANGELVFSAPWESRAFGMAVSLCRQGLYTWDAFRAHLIAEIRAWERDHPDDRNYDYWARWLAALETLLTDVQVARPGELRDAAAALAARPAGHDHAHD